MTTINWLAPVLVEDKDYFITGRANVIFCAVGLR